MNPPHDRTMMPMPMMTAMPIMITVMSPMLLTMMMMMLTLAMMRLANDYDAITVDYICFSY